MPNGKKPHVLHVTPEDYAVVGVDGPGDDAAISEDEIPGALPRHATQGSHNHGKRPVNLHRYLNKPDEFLKKTSFSDSDTDDSGSGTLLFSPKSPPVDSSGEKTVTHRNFQAKVARMRDLSLAWLAKAKPRAKSSTSWTGDSNHGDDDADTDDDFGVISPGSPGPPSVLSAEDEEADNMDHDVTETEAEADAEFKRGLINMIARQMMFVSGETAEPSIETTSAIEEITRQQVVEIVCSLFTALSYCI